MGTSESAEILEVATGRRLLRYGPEVAATRPGSTLKPFTLLALLEAGLDPTKRLPCPRQLTIGGRRFDCTHPPLHSLNAREALAYSCNNYFAAATGRLTVERWAKSLAAYGIRAGRPSDFFARLSRCLGLQRSHGVRFIASTDAGIPGVFHHELIGGLQALQRYAGMRPVEVLRAATVDAADALGLARETGRIAAGLSADLVVLRADPTLDLTALAEPLAVVFRGAWLRP